eukprot:maker-scaffold722_size106786-snap-gene-0.32 protein:Tk04294 transcript:maker-scaffold722_size106786-snap-gene-0.32-mRNA-1 annotation:"phospholipase a-2-activating protein isoform x2"
MSPYRFSTVLEGHSGDVRCLAVMTSAECLNSAYGLVSGSRDRSAKVWHPEVGSDRGQWVCERTLVGHDKYVTAVAVKEPDSKFPQGLIFTGSQDGHIRTYHPGANEAIGDTEAHAATVSALFISPTGTLISGSWDLTAKVWVDEMKLMMTLTGHEIAVWAVAILPECAIMLTTGADKTIKLWKGGQCRQTVEGAHSQAVRSLAIATKDSFMSCSNDCTVKLWQVDVEAIRATCAKTIQAHNNFIYSMSAFNQDKFIIGGEHSGIKIFQGTDVEQVLQVPAISIWSVAALPNGDIAAGCSDGKIWIFSTDEKRRAPEEMSKSYETALAGFHRPAETELEGVDVKKLPGIEALLAPGKKDGQTLMVRDGPNICVHSWSSVDQKWTKIGDVTGSAKGQNGAALDGGKVVYEGKEYDFVFDIDVDEGRVLKLGFNRDQDTYSGLIFTGSQDGHIRTYHPGANEAIGDTEAHAATVSALFISPTGTLISGSWDLTAKVWVDEMKLMMTLTGHEIAVWAVAILPECAIMLTTGADKTIKLWKGGQCRQTVEGAHSQAVRSLAIATKDSFMSCSNDCTVKLWQVDVEAIRATCAKTIQAHNNFIYSMSAFNQDKFIIGGEHSGIKIFQGTDVEQVLQVPAISIWSVAALPNGDIAAGCSDGKIWIFSTDEKRRAPEEMSKSYETALAGFHRPAETELEGVDVKKLPGIEALLAPGKKDGQTLMVRDGPNICVHSWSSVDQKWTKIGDVTGSAKGQNGAALDGGKVVYEGKEYDFVFDIDVDEGRVLKLGFNRDQDTGAYSTGSGTNAAPSARNSMTPSDSSYGGGGDPFTGGGSMDIDEPNTYFPQTSYLSFSAKPKVDMMIKKLKEFNAKANDDVKVKEDVLDRLPLLVSSDQDGSTGDIASLMKALRWPKDMAFPALDILRLAITNPKVNSMLMEDVVLNDLLSLLLVNMKPEMPVNCQMLAMRTLSNMFSVEKGERVMLQSRDSIITRLLALFPSENKNVQVAICTMMLNYAVAGMRKDDQECQVQIISSIAMLFLDAITEPEARFRVLVAVGTLIGEELNGQYFASMDGRRKINHWVGEPAATEKLRHCAKFIFRALPY